MRIEQRLMTTIDFLEPKPRGMAVIEEQGSRLLRITASDEQCEIRISAADFTRLREALVRGDDRRVLPTASWDSCIEVPALSDAAGKAGAARDALRVEHRLISSVDLGQGQPREFTVSQDSWGCKISGSRPGDVVQILMSHGDCRKLRNLVLGEVAAACFEPVRMVMPSPSPAFTAAQFVAQLGDVDWIAYN